MSRLTTRPGEIALLEARELCVGFPDRIVVENLSLEVRPGELLVLIGPNGSGKTTVLRTLAGLLPPIRGSVLLGPRDMRTFSARERALSLSFVQQTVQADWPYTVTESVFQARYPHVGWLGLEGAGDRRAVESALERTDLLSFRDRRVTELSGGELQRVLVARALAQESRYLLLDEPVSHLDPQHAMETLSLLSSLAGEGLAVAVSLHDLNLAALWADRIALIAEGRLLALGSPRTVLTGENLERVFGGSLSVSPLSDSPDHPLITYRKRV